MISRDIIRTICQVLLVIIAIFTLTYGYHQYQSLKSEKRPYISLTKVNVESNLTKKFPIIRPDLGKNVQPIEIIKSDQKHQDQLEEIIVELVYRNTGPLAAKNIDITSVILRSDRYDLKGKENPTSRINDKTDFRKLLDVVGKVVQDKRQTNLVSLLPEQEKTDYFLLHRNEIAQTLNIMRNDSTTTNYLYLVNRVAYTSSGKDNYEYFCVYRISHPAAYTRIYYADLIKSESI